MLFLHYTFLQAVVGNKPVDIAPDVAAFGS